MAKMINCENIKNDLVNPPAFDLQKALRRAFQLGQNYWHDAESESYRANKRADKHRQDFEALCEEALEATRHVSYYSQAVPEATNNSNQTPVWCQTHQHFKWCEHNGGVMGPNGYGPPKSITQVD